jgi:hypothetical protein
MLSRKQRKSGKYGASYGRWYGNDTIWRSVLDLNKLLHYGNADGKMHDTLQRNVLFIVDAITAGDDNGPRDPDAKECGVIVVGKNAVAVDTVCCALMGFDYKKVHVVNNAYKIKSYPLISVTPSDILIESNDVRFNAKSPNDITYEESYQFAPRAGWKGHIEKTQ